MTRITREQSEENRTTLLEASGRLFRERGIDGVGIADLCKAAGFTTGALYSQFGSKDLLAAEAFSHGQDASAARREHAVGADPLLADVLAFYLSEQHRDNLQDCCPLLASSSEAARQSAAYREAHRQAFVELSGSIGSGLKGTDQTATDLSSMVIAASMIGVASIARALAGSDRTLADALLGRGRELLGTLGPAAAKACEI